MDTLEAYRRRAAERYTAHCANTAHRQQAEARRVYASRCRAVELVVYRESARRRFRAWKANAHEADTPVRGVIQSLRRCADPGNGGSAAAATLEKTCDPARALGRGTLGLEAKRRAEQQLAANEDRPLEREAYPLGAAMRYEWRWRARTSCFPQQPCEADMAREQAAVAGNHRPHREYQRLAAQRFADYRIGRLGEAATRALETSVDFHSSRQHSVIASYYADKPDVQYRTQQCRRYRHHCRERQHRRRLVEAMLRAEQQAVQAACTDDTRFRYDAQLTVFVHGTAVSAAERHANTILNKYLPKMHGSFEAGPATTDAEAVPLGMPTVADAQRTVAETSQSMSRARAVEACLRQPLFHSDVMNRFR